MIQGEPPSLVSQSTTSGKAGVIDTMAPVHVRHATCTLVSVDVLIKVKLGQTFSNHKYFIILKINVKMLLVGHICICIPVVTGQFLSLTIAFVYPDLCVWSISERQS